MQDRRLTQREFAAQVGIDEDKFSKSMSGTRRFNSVELGHIAQAANVTVDWLLGVDRPAPALAARTRDVSSIEQAAIAEARRLGGMWADLAFLGYHQHAYKPRVSIAGVNYREAGQRLAEDALNRAAQFDRNPWECSDLASLVEEAFGVDVRIMKFETRYEGLSFKDTDCSLMVVGASEVPARQRFTIAHELGHLLAEDDQGVHLDTDLNEAAHKRQPSEKRANAFATEFLMPAKILRKRAAGVLFSDEQFAKLACDFRVSPIALAWRLYNLGEIDEPRCAHLRNMSGLHAATIANRLDDHWRWITAAEQPRYPLKLLRTIYDAYQKGDTTLRPLANLLQIDVDVLRQAMDGAREEIPVAQ